MLWLLIGIGVCAIVWILLSRRGGSTEAHSQASVKLIPPSMLISETLRALQGTVDLTAEFGKTYVMMLGIPHNQTEKHLKKLETAANKREATEILGRIMADTDIAVALQRGPNLPQDLSEAYSQLINGLVEVWPTEDSGSAPRPFTMTDRLRLEDNLRKPLLHAHELCYEAQKTYQELSSGYPRFKALASRGLLEHVLTGVAEGLSAPLSGPLTILSSLAASNREEEYVRAWWATFKEFVDQTQEVMHEVVRALPVVKEVLGEFSAQLYAEYNGHSTRVGNVEGLRPVLSYLSTQMHDAHQGLQHMGVR